MGSAVVQEVLELAGVAFELVEREATARAVVLLDGELVRLVVIGSGGRLGLPPRPPALAARPPRPPGAARRPRVASRHVRRDRRGLPGVRPEDAAAAGPRGGARGP